MSRVAKALRASLAILGAVVVLGIGMHAVNWVSYLALRSRLAPLYAVAGSLRKGMPGQDVLRLIDRHASSHMSSHVFPDGDITLWVQYSLMDTCSTAIGFRNGLLERTWTIGEDSPADYCPGSPPDVR